MSEVELDQVVEQLKQLPTPQQEEVAQFIASLRAKRQTSSAEVFTRMSEPAFARVWDNDEDAAYDEL